MSPTRYRQDYSGTTSIIYLHQTTLDLLSYSKFKKNTPRMQYDTMIYYSFWCFGETNILTCQENNIPNTVILPRDESSYLLFGLLPYLDDSSLFNQWYKTFVKRVRKNQLECKIILSVVVNESRSFHLFPSVGYHCIITYCVGIRRIHQKYTM